MTLFSLFCLLIHRSADPSFGESIQSIQPLEPLLHRRGQEPNSLEPLRRIEALAIASISIAAASRQLKTLRVSHSHEREQHFIPGIDIVASPSSNQTNFTLLINTSALIRKAGPKAASFALNILRLEVHGYSRRHNTVTYHVHGQLRPSAKQSPETFTGVQDKDVMIKRNGRFGLKLTVPFGQSCTEALTNRLLSLHRARSCATALQKNNINLNSINLSRITFTYSATTISSTNSSGPTNLNAEISFSDIPNAKNPISIIFPPLNPHRRIQALLTRILNYRGGEARSDLPFGFFVAFLRISLPLVRALDIIEDKDLSADTKQQSSTGLNFHARSCDWYRIEYKQKGVTLDVKLKRIRDELVWFIDEAPLPPIKSQGQQQQEQPQKSPALVDAMEKVLGSRGKGWRGLHSCIKANADGGVEDALLRLDEVIRSEGVAENGTTNSATTAVTAAPTGGAAKANQSAASGAAQIKQQPQQQRQEVITLD